MNFAQWLDTFVQEKNLDTEHIFEVEGDGGANYIPLGCVIEQIKVFSDALQANVKRNIVKIDFANGDVLHFFEHIAKRMAL